MSYLIYCRNIETAYLVYLCNDAIVCLVYMRSKIALNSATDGTSVTEHIIYVFYSFCQIALLTLSGLFNAECFPGITNCRTNSLEYIKLLPYILSPERFSRIFISYDFSESSKSHPLRGMMFHVNILLFGVVATCCLKLKKHY